MARGKPKGIRRKIAKNKESFLAKQSISHFGDAAENPEFNFIQHILDSILFFSSSRRWGGGSMVRLVRRHLEEYIADRIITAVGNHDSLFFQRCMEVIDAKKANPIDPMAVRILDVVERLLSAHPGRKISSEMICRELERRYPRDDDQFYIPRDVRGVLRGLGIKCPIDRAWIRASIEEDVNAFFSKLDKDTDALDSKLAELKSFIPPHK